MNEAIKGDHCLFEAGLRSKISERTKLLVVWARANGVPRQDCADIAQECLAGAVEAERTQGVQQAATIDRWLFGIMRHKISDYWRHHYKMGHCQHSTGDTHIDGFIYAQGARSIDAAILIRQVLDSLPSDLQQVLLLNLFEGCTTHEISSILQLPPGTVGRKLAEAKRAFRLRAAGPATHPAGEVTGERNGPELDGAGGPDTDERTQSIAAHA